MAIDVTPYPEHRKLLSTPDAGHLAELYLLQADMDAARGTLSLYFDKFAASGETMVGEEAIISASLFRDGIVLFCACFSTRDPHKLHPKSVYGHMDGWEAYCQKLLDIRDAFVAHNFGPQRQHKIAVAALEIDGKLIPAAFTQFFARFKGWTADERERLLLYIDVAREHLKKLIAEAELAVQEALEVITPEELAALPDFDLKIPADRDYRTNRGRFLKSGRGEPFPIPPHRLIQTIEGELEPRRSDQRRAGPDEEAPPTEPEPTR